MKKTVKIILIALGSVVGLVLIAVAAALWFVFTPSKLTPMVNEQAGRFVTCRVETDRVELTFFSTFPRLGIKVDGMRLINPTDGAPCDTLADIGRVAAAIDVKAFLRRSELILRDIELRDGRICLFADSLGRVNYDILKSEPETEADTAGMSIGRIDIDRIDLKNIDILYADRTLLADARVDGISGRIKVSVNDGAAEAAADLEPFDLGFSMGGADSLLALFLKGASVKLDGSLNGEKGMAGIELRPTSLTLAYGGEEYFRDLRVALKTEAGLDMETETVSLQNAAISFGEFSMTAGGSMRNAPEGFDMDLAYELAPSSIADLLAILPGWLSAYFGGIELSGSISSGGTVRGFYGDGSMPVLDMNVRVEEGNAAWPEMLPYPLREVSADFLVHTGFEDANTYVKINNLRARIPNSSIRAWGTADRLMSDPHARFTADLAGDLSDAAPFIPADMGIKVAGKASGRLDADVSMSQVERMAMDEMKVSGSLLLSGFEAIYDTVKVASPSARLDFSMPNSKPSFGYVGFAALTVSSGNLEASTTGGTGATARDLRIALEISDIRDTLSVPGVVCDFSAGRLAVSSDGMKANVTSPSGRVSMAPSRRDASLPRVKVRFGSGNIDASAGAEQAAVGKLDIDATVVYDESKEDFWQMLSPSGFIVADAATAHLTSLNYPVEIPTLAADFNPNSLDVRRVRVKLDESDFSLRGRVENILSYFRGDSILRAEFDFTSPVTNITQLLALTSGIGDEEAGTENGTGAASGGFSGPYMVPRGVDIALRADISKALWYADDPEPKVFSDIKGDVRVLDGTMFVSPELSFRSPATDGQLEIIYRTPRKNHLFAGTSLHLERIEIQELVGLIPDLDSIMPMLRAFDGRGEFHLAFEGYMDSTYRFKISTLRGAASVAAANLTMKDDELFRKIAFLLKYKDEGVIRVDSLSAEFTVFRDEVDVYPFLLSVDRYKAVISGRHNLDMSFDYNISVVQSPLPFRMSVDVTGTPDDLKFKVFSKSRFPEFYRPPYRRVVQNQQMELRNLIRKGLTAGAASRSATVE